MSNYQMVYRVYLLFYKLKFPEEIMDTRKYLLRETQFKDLFEKHKYKSITYIIFIGLLNSYLHKL